MADVNDARHFPNDFDDSQEPPGWEPAVRRALADGEAQVRAAGHSTPSVYVGEAGVAFAMLHLAARALGQSHPETKGAAQEALRRLQASERDFSPRRVTLLEGLPGNVVLQAWAHRCIGQRKEANDCLGRLRDLAAGPCGLERGECEVLYGRCGFLGAVLLARARLGDPTALAEEAVELVRQVLNAGKAGAAATAADEDADGGAGAWPLRWEWHEKCYYGGAHGIAGILLTLLQLHAELAQAGQDALPLIRGTADRLLACRFESGNLPSSEGSRRDSLVHFCHGATGLVPLLLKLAEVYEEPRYLGLARAAGQVVWKRGLLSTKGPGLCHGIAGNGYALLCLFRATEDRLWLRRAQHFAAVAAEKAGALARYADRPNSLFEGLAGAACFWADVLHASGPRPDAAGAGTGAAGAGAAGGARDVRFPCYEF